MSNWPELDPKKIEAAREDAKANMSWAQLSKKHGIPVGRLRRICADVHQDTRKLPTSEIIASIRAARSKGELTPVIAKRFGFSVTTIARHCRDLPARPIGFKYVRTDGYVFVYVGKSHHLANESGYAFEHRIVAEEKLGRRLTDVEIVHHLDENPLNNNPDNLEVLDRAHHAHVHGKDPCRQGFNANYKILCACGCGTEINAYENRKLRTRIRGHYHPWVSEEKVREIFDLRKRGVVWNVIAEKLGISRRHAGRIFKGESHCASIPEDLRRDSPA
jgi:hypothetical protein